MIRITKLELISFGRFENCIIEPSDGLNIVYGVNEAGKSTVQLFIKSMLYGAPAGRGKGVKTRERIIPWGKNCGIGRMTLIKDDLEIEIYRGFGSRPSEDVVKVIGSADGTDYFDGAVSSAEVGEQLLGMSESMFERTVWIAQDGVAFSGSNDEITGRLTNILQSGSDNISASAAEQRLNKQISALKAKDRRSAPGEIDRLEAKRAELSDSLESQKRLHRESENLLGEISGLENEIERLDREIKHLTALEQSERAKEKVALLKRLDNCLAEEIQIGNTRQFQLFKNKIKDDTADKIHEWSDSIDKIEIGSYRLNDEKSGLEQKQAEIEKRKRLWPVLTVIFAILTVGTAAAVILLKNPVLWSAAAVMLALTARSVFSVINTKKDEKEIQVRLEETEQKISDSRGNIARLEINLSETLHELGCDTVRDFDKKFGLYCEAAAKIRAVLKVYEDLLDGRDYHQIKSEADENSKYILDETPPQGVDLRQAIEERSQKRNQIAERLTELKVEAGRHEPMIPIIDIENNIELIDEQLREKNDELEALRLALGGLREARALVRSDYTPTLNKRAGEILAGLTGSKHQDMRIAENFSIKLKERDVPDLKQAELFSAGTYSQIYLALRLAIAELTQSAEDIIVFLDDVLIGFDDERAERAVELLKERNRQTVLFTCHKREVLNAEKIGGINIIKMTD